MCISSIGRGIGGASPSPVIFWIGWKTNGVCCCLYSWCWLYNVYLEKWQSGVGGWLHRLMLITGLVASREIWRHGIRRTIRKQSQPSWPIVNTPQQSLTVSIGFQQTQEDRNLDQNCNSSFLEMAYILRCNTEKLSEEAYEESPARPMVETWCLRPP